MNGAVFDGLTKLSNVFLDGNVCTDASYFEANTITRLSKEVDDKCGFASTEGNFDRNTDSKNQSAAFTWKSFGFQFTS